MRKISGFENGLYYLLCFLTFGGAYFHKVIVRKALSETE